MLQHIRLGSRIEGLVRQDFYELPIKSIREMIANAVCHRSYLVPQKIQVALYDDRLEVTTPGMLSRDITITKMELGQSLIRNKGIAAVFSYMSIIEGWGSGIPRIIKEAEEYHLQRPELIDMGGSFRMNLFRRDFEIDQYGVIDPKNGVNQTNQTNTEKGRTDTETDTETNQTNTEKGRTDTETDTEKELTDTESAVIRILLTDSSATIHEIAEACDLSVSGVRYVLNKLRDKGIVERIGAQKNGQWIVKAEF